MEWTPQAISEVCQELCDIVGLEFTIPVVINGRLTRTLGRVISSYKYSEQKYVPVKMEISRQLLETATEETIRGIIAHEVAHYIVVTETTDGETHGHDAVFKNACARIGCTENKAKATKIDRVTEVKYKYEVWCDGCGKRLAQYSRMSKTLKNLHSCRCGYCQSDDLRIVQNW